MVTRISGLSALLSGAYSAACISAWMDIFLETVLRYCPLYTKSLCIQQYMAIFVMQMDTSGLGKYHSMSLDETRFSCHLQSSFSVNMPGRHLSTIDSLVWSCCHWVSLLYWMIRNLATVNTACFVSAGFPLLFGPLLDPCRSARTRWSPSTLQQTPGLSYVGGSRECHKSLRPDDLIPYMPPG